MPFCRMPAAAALGASLAGLCLALAIAEAAPKSYTVVQTRPIVIAQPIPRIPPVVGKTRDSARMVLATTHLPIVQIDSITSALSYGRVMMQRPVAGTLVAATRAETLWIGVPSPKMIATRVVVPPGAVATPVSPVPVPRDTVVPNLYGGTPNLVSAALETTHLRLGKVFQDSSDQMAAGHVFSQDPKVGTRVGFGRTVDVWYSLGPHNSLDTVSVPPVESLSIARARLVLQRRGLNLGRVTTEERRGADSLIVHQEPHAGTTAHRNDPVDVIIDVEPALVTVPDVTHMSNTDARNKLESVGLEVGAITIITRAGATAAIDSQRPTGGSRVAAHSLIDLVEADAPIVRRAVVPNLKGKTQSDAERTLLADSLDVGTVVRSDDDSAAKITAQNPLFGDAVVFHSRVSFRLSNTGARDTLFIRVPPVKTLTIEKAERTLADSGFSHIRITGNSAAAAVVVDQSPRAGTLVPPGTLVSIAGELPEVHRVPKLTGRRELDARAEAERDGFYMLVLNQHRAFRWTEVVVSQTPGVGAPDRGDRRVDVDLDIPALPPVPTAIVLGIAGIAAVMIKLGRKPPHPKGNGFSVTDATPPPGLPTVASKGGDRLIRSTLEYDFSFEVDSPTLDIECRSDTLIQSEKVRNG